MVFSVYLPPQAENNHLPHLYWLSGLTCDDQNFVTKAGAQRYAAEHGVIIIAPDTSPRGDGVPDTEAWDFAQGAGFYLNATQQPWSKNYQMESYLLNELIPIVVVQAKLETASVSEIELQSRKRGCFASHVR